MMKFSEMPYSRPSVADVRAAADRCRERIQNASCAPEQIAAYGGHAR